MTERVELRDVVANVVRELISSQAADGYLGPFPKAERLRGYSDLWGHYHVLAGLLMWHEATGDETALQAARRAADLICVTFLDSNIRVLDAGSPEMHMAMINGLGRLFLVTRQPRYLQLMREIEKERFLSMTKRRKNLERHQSFYPPMRLPKRPSPL